MRAIRVHQWGGPEVLKAETGVAVPVPGDDQVRDRRCCQVRDRCCQACIW